MDKNTKDLVNKEIEQSESKYNSLLEEFKNSITILKRYIENPAVVADEISNSDLPIKDDFKEISLGLQGTFTKAKATDMGRKKILSYINSLINQLKQNKIILGDYVSKLISNIKDHYSVIYNNIDISVQERRKEQYMSHHLYTDLFKNRMSNYLTEVMCNLGIARGEKEILFGFREVLSMLSLYNTDDLDKKYENFKFRTEYIANNYVYAGTNQFKQDKFVIDSNSIDKTVNNALCDYMDKIEEEQDTTEEELNILNNIIDILDRVLNKLKENIDNVEAKLKTMVAEDEFYNLVIDKIHNDIIIPYSNAEITAADFVVKIKDSFITLENLATIEHDLRIMMYNVCSKYKTDLDIFSKIYDTVNEITFKGSMTELKKRKEED